MNVLIYYSVMLFKFCVTLRLIATDSNQIKHLSCTCAIYNLLAIPFYSVAFCISCNSTRLINAHFRTVNDDVLTSGLVYHSNCQCPLNYFKTDYYSWFCFCFALFVFCLLRFSLTSQANPSITRP